MEGESAPGSARTAPRRLGALGTAALLASLLPPLLIAIVIARYGVNVPMGDQWRFAPEVLDFLSGSHGWRRLWTAAGQHRVVLPKAGMLALAAATRWDVRAEMWFDFGCAVASFALLAALARRSLAGLAPVGWACSVIWISAALFSLAAWQSWTFGWMMNAHLAVLGASFSAWACGRYAATGRGAALIVLGAVVAALSYLSGLLLLVLVPVAIALAGDARRVRRGRHAALAALAAVGLIAAYFVGYPAAKVAREVGAAKLDASAVVLFVLRYAGAPLAAGRLTAALAWGAVAIGMVVVSALAVFARRAECRRMLVPWLLLAGFAIANGAATACGRVAAGRYGALLSRYALLSSLLWASLPACAMIAVRTVGLRRRTAATRLVVTGALAGAVLLAGRGYVATGRTGLAAIQARSGSASRAAGCVLNVERAPDRCLRPISGKQPWRVRRIAPRLRDLGLGPFAAAATGAKRAHPPASAASPGARSGVPD